MSTLKHIHAIGSTDWHNGSLADCPETEWDDIETLDGKPARMARGMSVQLPPETSRRLRLISDVPEIV